MPKIFEWKGCRFHFFSNEGEPLESIHIHVRKGQTELIEKDFFKKRINTMKQELLNDTVGILHRIETIEREVKDLKLSVLKKLTPTGKKVISLKGILKGIDVTDKDIASAKKSLYSKIEI